MKLPVAILAGGLATRLYPVTEKYPKALLDVAGQPFILRQLAYLSSQGANRVVLCTGYLGEQIETVVGNRFGDDVTISYSRDWPKLLGTGGALKQALPLLGSRFLVLYGDSYLPIDFAAVEEAFLASGKPALMTVQRNIDRWDKSNVLFEDGRLVEYNKRTPRPQMQHIDYGLGGLTAEVFEGTDSDRFDLADIYWKLSLEGQLAGYEVNDRFYEIGSHDGLRETVEYFERGGR